MPSFLIDGSWVDIGTLTTAAAYAVFRMLFTRQVRIESFVSDVSYGASIFPMLLLSTAAFSSGPISALLNGNRVILSLAGLFSLIILVKRTFERPPYTQRHW